MLISGFTFARNTEKLGYPTAESIRSILPVCDEFVIALGKGDDDDTTREKILSIGDPKIKIIDTEWNDLATLKSRIYSQQTNLALSKCSGIWCFYLQSDEVVHEKHLEEVRSACEYFSDDRRVDGFLFNYKHFWGDYDHFFISHRWYPREVRIVRNYRNIVSVGDAQSFRYATHKKIPVVSLKAEVFHYGHVRDPRIVGIRHAEVHKIYKGADAAAKIKRPELYDYGSLADLPVYRDTYPAVMQERIAAINWKHLLQYEGTSTVIHGHNKLKYRVLTWIEQVLLRGSGIEFWGYKPFRRLWNVSKQFSRNRADTPSPDKLVPKVSLIIAVYNRPEILEKVFFSLFNQSFVNFEIVIADDGSGPEIAELIARFEGRFLHPVQHVWHPDDGFRKTIIVNKAVVAAKTGYCIFIDGDCLLHHRFIEYHCKRKMRGTVLAGRRVMFNEALSAMVTLDDISTGRIEHRSFWGKKCNRAGKKHGIFIPGAFHIRNITPRKSNDILGANFSVYKEDFLAVNGYDERIIGRGLEDDNLSARFTMAKIRIKTIAHEALQYHLYHTSKPIPHSKATIDQFRNHPEAARTPFGIVKE